ncbi:adenylate cyclase [Afipia sp. P52-10]|nr:adenylate cyclase [Afipia sp. P52-10]
MSVSVKSSSIAEIGQWVVARGLAGASEADLLDSFCARCREAGLRLSHGLVIIDTLHPTYEGRAFWWDLTQTNENRMIEYGPTNTGEAAEKWRRSSFYHLLQSGEPDMRIRIGQDLTADFLNLDRLRSEGHTDYIAFVHRFDRDGSIGEMDAVYSHWTTTHDDGFADDELEALRTLVPSLSLAAKCMSLVRVAGTLVEVYLGRDTGRRVLAGQISRGVAERIHAVLWYSDLRDFTAISETIPPEEIMPMLNAYAEAVISSIQSEGGEVLKLTGDGVLAIFNAEIGTQAGHAALRAERAMRLKVEALNQQRAADGRPVTEVYLGLHVGDVFYGNIGSGDRLDFTVIGPAVNEVCRIATMCRSAGRLMLASTDFIRAATRAERQRLVSVGRFALRGVERPRELFTLDRYHDGDPAGHAN